MEHKGKLKVASSLEILHAMLLVMPRDSTDVKVEVAVLAEWLVMASSCIATFKVLDDSADIMLYQENLREELWALQGPWPAVGCNASCRS